jgi:HsdM N-terminal domain
MPIKKSELYSSLWESCDELRGGMDASQYKDYVLVLLFVKYVSDKYAGQKDALLDVPVGGRFADMVALKGHKEIGDKMNKIIGNLAEAKDHRSLGIYAFGSRYAQRLHRRLYWIGEEYGYQSKRVGAREKTILAIETTPNTCYSNKITIMRVARKMCNDSREAHEP